MAAANYERLRSECCNHQDPRVDLSSSNRRSRRCWSTATSAIRVKRTAAGRSKRVVMISNAKNRRMLTQDDATTMTSTTDQAKRTEPTGGNRRPTVARATSIVPTTLLLLVLLLVSGSGGPPSTNSDTTAAVAGTNYNQPLLLVQAEARAPSSSPLLSSLYLSSSSSLVGAAPASILKRDLSFRMQPPTEREQRQPTATTTTSGVRQRTPNVCQVSDGESVAIVEIEESRGSDMSQSTNPLQLPIRGSVGDEIELRIESETHKYFQIQDKSLRLTRPLDRDAILKQNSSQIQQHPISSIYLQVSCLDKTSSQPARKVIIPVLVKVLDLNDNAPKFSSPVYTVQVDELAPVGSIVLDQIQALDLDSANNGLIEYSLLGRPSAASAASSLSHPAQSPPRLVQRANPSGAESALIVAAATTLATTTSTSTTTTPQTSPSPTAIMSNAPSRATTQAPTSFAADSSADGEHQSADMMSTTAAVSESAPPGATSAAGSGTRLSGPTINLNSEPIVNGPMEDGEDEESDEALLAALNNSTDTGEPDSSDSDSMVLMMPSSGGSSGGTGAVGRRRKKRGSQEQPTTTLWTNLMAVPSSVDDSTTLGGANQQQFDEDSLDYFTLELTANNKPVIRLKKALDYETKRVHTLTIQATDKATNKQERLSSTANIVVRVLDGDDQGPAFVLDQTGCATGSLPQPTTVSSLSAAATTTTTTMEPALVLRRRQLSPVEPAAPADGGEFDLAAHESSELGAPVASVRPTSQTLPKGFKVTDENFEFSDMTTGDEADDEQLQRGRNTAPGAELANIAAATASASTSTAGAGGRARRYPAGGQSTGLSGVAGVVALGGRHAVATMRPHYQDYSCLPQTTGRPFGGSGQAEYFAAVMSGDSDLLLRVAPQAIKARDRDELNAPIRYSFINGTPTNYSLYFQINPLDASIKQIAALDKGQPNRFVIWVQAQEQTSNRLSSVAKLTIDVVATDKNPPVLVPNSYSGFIEENSPIGTSVAITAEAAAATSRSSNNNNQNYSALMRISVVDPDNSTSGGGSQLYEFETTSEAFKVNKDGFVYVNRWPLDRDSPASQIVHMFQVTARQIGLAHSSRSISSPVSINVTLLDLNDNPPTISNSSLLPLKITASNRGARTIGTIRALDADSPQNARALFSIHHVSNGGRERFRIGEDSGQLEALGKFSAGEQFSLTLQVADELGRSSQGILEVLVIPGPNTGGPQFVVEGAVGGDNSRGYSIEINEGVAPHSPILQVHAADPENDPIAYSIVDGNINNDFYINSKTGQIYVANKLDREEVSGYTLLVQARDSGGLATNRPVHIGITDNNDQNPTFGRSQYVFTVDEGVAGRTIGRVSASDGDAGDNGLISYQLDASSGSSSFTTATSDASGRPLFSIHSETGELKVLEALDYEQAKSYTLIVSATDHGENPRSTTARVLVRVLDVQDEAPYFERYYLETRVPENQPAPLRVAQVQARDPDSVAQVTYVLKSGDASLFAVDPQTGLVSTLRGLDFEEARQHTLLVGTIENQERDLLEVANQLADSIRVAAAAGSGQPAALERSPICRIDIQVLDLNDNAPQFVGQPMPVRIQDTAQLGTVVARLTAEDADGTEPNNLVRYELVSGQQASKGGEHHVGGHHHLHQSEVTSEKCAQSFMVDATSGSISVKSDLRRDSQSECQLVVRARDLGQQQQQPSGSVNGAATIGSLSSLATITIFIDHLAEISPASQIGFADTSFTVEVEENSPASSLVKVLPIVNKPKINFPMSCEIVSGNELAKFYVVENEQRDCELRTRDSTLDYELRQRYSLVLRLNTIGASSRTTLAQVNVNILDRNDNRPAFQPPARYGHLTQNRFLAAIATDAPSDTQVLQLRASDPDSAHSNGLVSYELLNDQDLGGRFKVDPIDGIVRTSRPVEDVPSTRLPLRLKVMARDNPELPSNSLETIAELVVNLIDDRHRMALVLKDAPTGRALDSKEELLGVLQERTGLISGLEKAESLKIQRNGTLEPDVSGTDFWFYLIEPGTFRIVPSDDPRVRASLFEQRSQSSLLDIVGQTLGFNAARVRLPYSISGGGGGGRSSASTAGYFGSFSTSRAILGSLTSLASALIMIALFIAIISAIVVVFQCGSWSSYSRATKEKLYMAAGQMHPPPGQSYYSQPPPSLIGGCPAAKGGGALSQRGGFNGQDNYAFRSGFSTLGAGSHLGGSFMMPPHPQQLINGGRNNNNSNSSGGPAEPTYQFEPPQAAEYETQMLKMSVLFDDSHSLDEQHLNENNVSKNLTGH